MLAQLCHPWSTQKNEAMNNSVNAYSQKGKTYSLTTSLDTRVAITAATQVIGYHRLWVRIYDAFAIQLDENLSSHLKSRDKAKRKKSAKQKSIKGKIARSQKKYDKFNKAKSDWDVLQVDSIGYQTGIAVTLARKSLPSQKDRNEERNPPGTPQEQLRCPFYPTYCNVKGHRDARSKVCAMSGKDKQKDRDVAKKSIEAVAVQGEIEKLSKKGKKGFVQKNSYFSVLILNLLSTVV